MADKCGGWIKLHRSIMENEFYMAKPFSKGQAWIDLLLLAEHKTHKKMWRGNIVEFKRGDVNLSIQRLAERWGWSRHKVERFLDNLSDQEMIYQKVNRNRTVLTIVKYSDFQSRGASDGTSDGTSKRQSDGTSNEQSDGQYYKNNKNDIEIKEEPAAPKYDEYGNDMTDPDYDWFEALEDDRDKE